MLTTDDKLKVITDHQTGKADVGSTPVQIALLTERINHLTGHLKTHQKDLHSERGLTMMVGRRKRLLEYYAKQDPTAYRELVKQLKLRK